MAQGEELLFLAESIARKAGALLMNRPSKFDLDEKSEFSILPPRWTMKAKN